MDFGRKSLRIIGWVLLVQILLVATHEGEFWPFSIYPMFSQAGNPWTRSLVRQVDADRPEDWSATQSLDELPGEVLAMNRVGINQNDLANFLQKNKTWDEVRVDGLRKLFKPVLDEQPLLVYKVTGRLQSDPDTVVVTYQPYIYLNSDTTIFNRQVLMTNSGGQQ